MKIPERLGKKIFQNKGKANERRRIRSERNGI